MVQSIVVRLSSKPRKTFKELGAKKFLDFSHFHGIRSFYEFYEFSSLLLDDC